MINEYQKLAKKNEEMKLLLILEAVFVIIEIYFVVNLAIAVHHVNTEKMMVFLYTIEILLNMTLILLIIVPLTTDVEICETGIRQTILNERIIAKSYLWDELVFVGRVFVKGYGRMPDSWFLVCSKKYPEHQYKNSVAYIFKSKDTIYISDIEENRKLLCPFFKK